MFRGHHILKTFSLLFCLLSLSEASSQDKALHWFPKQEIFPLLRADLYETQPLFGVYYLNAPDSNYSGAYFPVNLAFRKSLVQWKMGKWQSQIGFGAGVYTQFEVSKNGDDKLLAGMLNSDFRALFLWSFQKQINSFRLRVFHMSSHLADDYMLRNDFFRVNNSKGNYEQLDITYSYSLPKIQPYMGLAYIFSPNAFRKRWSVQLGLQSNIQSQQVGAIQPVFGLDVQLHEEYIFEPNIHGNFGFSFNISEPASIIIQTDFYSGRLPYSTIELGRTYWLGLSTIIGL